MPQGQYTDSDVQQTGQIQHGQYSEADVLPEQSFTAGAKEFGRQMNPISIAQGIWQTVRHPIDTAKAYLDAKQQMVNDAEESLSKGDWGGFVRHMQTAAFPLPGIDVAVEQASNKWDSGDKAGALGDAAALVSQLAIAPRVPGALKATGRGIAAAAPDVLAGGAKVAAGEALAKLPGMEFPARIAMGYPGARQIARGLGKGASAAFGGGEADEPVAAATKAAPAAAAKTPGQLLAESDGKTWNRLGTAQKQLYEQIAASRPKFEANVAAEGPNVPKPPRTPESYGVTASQQVPRETPVTPVAAEAPPQSAPSAPATPQAATPAPTQSTPAAPPQASTAPTVAQPAPAPSTAAQPWQMTRSEIGKVVHANDSAQGLSVVWPNKENGWDAATDTQFTGMVKGTGEDAITNFHKSRIQSALKQGRPVPPEVLADYPQIAAAKTPGQLLAEQDGKTWAKVPKAEKQVYEQIATLKPKFEANAAGDQPAASQQAVPRETPPAAEVQPATPTPPTPVSAQPAPAAAPIHTIPANKFEPAVGGEDPTAINAYRQQIHNGQEIPPVEAAYHPSTGKLNVIDGYHRLAAYRAEGQPVKVTIANADEFPNEVRALSTPAASEPGAPEPPKPQTPADIAKAATAKGKADRFVGAIQRYNIDFPDREPITAKGLDAIKDDDHAKSVLTQALKSGGYLNNFEKFTDTSFPYIVQGLKDAESGGNLAQQLAESIRRARANRASAGR